MWFTKQDLRLIYSDWAAAQHFLQGCMCAQQRLRATCASAQSDQRLHRALCGRKGSKTSYGGQQLLWSDCADAQADQSHCWAHMQSCRMCCASAQLWVWVAPFMVGPHCGIEGPICASPAALTLIAFRFNWCWTYEFAIVSNLRITSINISRINFMIS